MASNDILVLLIKTRSEKAQLQQKELQRMCVIATEQKRTKWAKKVKVGNKP